MFKLSIVLPVFREASRLKDSLASVAEFVNSYEGGAEAIFVNDGSPDNCADIIRAYIAAHPEYPVKLISYELNQGKGFAVKEGVLKSEGQFILMSDTDLSTPLKDCSKLMAGIDAGADIVCGSRAVIGSEIGDNPPLLRRMLSRVFNVLVRISGVHGIRDTQCGFKLFKADVAKMLFKKMRIRAFAFDVELIARAKASDFKVVEVPVHWDYSGHSTVRVFTHGSKMLFDVFLLALKRVFRGKDSLNVRNGVR
ncbi:MAG: glycosyltransferase family 2 protein [Kiritimatiellae bacterium]|jgi:dolichyl-phosphate beta-glucosyltransferase|nr:glycosyltransferase family 2 protein [Kiritimatiellia bacterium]